MKSIKPQKLALELNKAYLQEPDYPALNTLKPNWAQILLFTSKETSAYLSNFHGKLIYVRKSNKKK